MEGMCERELKPHHAGLKSIEDIFYQNKQLRTGSGCLRGAGNDFTTGEVERELLFLQNRIIKLLTP